MGQAQINVRTRACSRTSIARTRQAALTHNVRGKELNMNGRSTSAHCSAGLKIASNWSPWATKNRLGRIEIMTREPFFFFFFFFFFLGLPLQVLLFEKR